MKQWPHMPVHYLQDSGIFIVTAGTYRKEHLFRDEERLSLLHDQLLSLADELDWKLQAWAVLSNHYHFVGISPHDPSTLSNLTRRLHSATAIAVNRLDGTPGRKVWYEYWETQLTFERSYLARLKYVHQNPVKHGIVQVAEQYPWCSASWFERTASPRFYRAVNSFKIDRVRVDDDY